MSCCCLLLPLLPKFGLLQFIVLDKIMPEASNFTPIKLAENPTLSAELDENP